MGRRLKFLRKLRVHVEFLGTANGSEARLDGTQHLQHLVANTQTFLQ